MKKVNKGLDAIILIIEDDELLIKIWGDSLKDEPIEILWAQTIERALDIFKENMDDIQLIVMDACVPGNKPNTISLVKVIRKSGFYKPIIAKSTIDLYRERLLMVGATIPALPEEIPELIRKFMKTTQ